MKIAVYICHCEMDIGISMTDVEQVKDFTETLPNVEVARNYMYMCSEPGQELLKKDIEKLGIERVVIIAFCSTKIPGLLFRNTCEEAGLNKGYVKVINMEEGSNIEKIKEMITKAVEEAPDLKPLEEQEVNVTPATLVIGGGIAGMYAALNIADAGFKVYLVEKEPSIGGHMAQLDKTFPTLDCSACIMTPRMVDVARHPNIELLTYAEVEDIEGYVGNFKLKIRKKPRYVDEEKCTGCGECANVCPVGGILSEFNLGLGERKAIYVPFPQAVPLIYTIDKREGVPPCRVGCPAGVNVQGYVALISQRKYKEALDVIRENNPLPAVCGYVCPHPCEDECNRGKYDEPISIAALKRFAADHAYKTEEKEKEVEITKKEKVAIIGSGPAGLTAAFYLRKNGYKVKVFERLPVVGGMLSVGIPKYRLPREALNKDIEHIKSIGVEIKTNELIDKEKFEQLHKEYDATFISVGAHESRKLGVKGEDLEGVIHGVQFLRNLNIGEEAKVGKKVVVIGGGDVAIDAARCALRLGSEVTIIYRRSREEMPARKEEVEAAEEEGIKIEYLAAPTRIIGKNGRVNAIECIRMELGAPDESGRRRPIPIKGSEFVIDVDMVIPAIGQSSNLAFLEGSGVEAPKGRWITADDNCMTSKPGIFAGGDAVTGPAIVIDAVAAGRKAAIAIDKYLSGESLPSPEEEEKKIEIEDIPEEELPKEKKERKRMPKISIEERNKVFHVVELGFTEEEAIEEAKRCLNCGICSECKLCVEACGERGAINHEMKEEMIELNVGAIIVATGYDLFDPKLKPEYGYGIYENVITGLEFERLCSASGPTQGEIEINGKEPKDVVFISCVGSRDKQVGNEYCSRVCCMYTAKQAHLVKEHLLDANITICYMDVRAFGKGFEEFYERVQEEGITYRRGNPGEIYKKGEKLIVKGEDTLLGEPYEIEADLVVLATAIVPRKETAEIIKALNLSQSSDGFMLEEHPKIGPVDTAIEGVFLAGCCQSPKDIPDTVAQAKAAAAAAISPMTIGKVKIFKK